MKKMYFQKGECFSGMMYVEWYGVCICVVFSVVEQHVDYGGVCVQFFVRFIWCLGLF